MPASRTAQGVARARGMMMRPAPASGDAAGEERLNADLAAELAVEPPDPDKPSGAGMFEYLTGRTQFFDRAVMDAIARGVTQIVIAGAGYDGRALRFRADGVRFFELDLPATQDDKRARLARLDVVSDDITFVPVDLADRDTAARLASAGHDEKRPSLFVCEGLLLYLEQPVVEALFGAFRARAAPGSTLALSLGLRDHGGGPLATARRAAFRRRLVRIGEPPRTRLTRAEWEGLLAATGWAIESTADPHAPGRQGLGGGSLLVAAGPS